MEKGKILHIMGFILMFIVVLPVIGVTASSVYSSVINSYSLEMYSRATTFAIALGAFCFYLFYFILFIRSFWKSNINNWWFKIASVLNFILILLIISFIILLIKTTDPDNPEFGGILIIPLWALSFIPAIVFIIGYFRNKKIIV